MAWVGSGPFDKICVLALEINDALTEGSVVLCTEYAILPKVVL